MNSLCRQPTLSSMVAAAALLLCSVDLGAQEVLHSGPNTSPFPSPGAPPMVLSLPRGEAIYLNMSAGTVRQGEASASSLHRQVGETVPKIEGFLIDDSPGDPALPYRVYRVALPPDADPSTLRLEITQLEERQVDLPRVPPAPPWMIDTSPLDPGYDAARIDHLRWGSGKQIVGGRNTLIYNRNALYPSQWADVVASGRLRKWQIAAVRFYPLRINPVTGEARQASRLGVRLTFDRDPTFLDDPSSLKLLRDNAFDRLAAGLTLNAAEAKKWYDGLLTTAKALAPAEAIQPPELKLVPRADFLVVTTEALFSASTELEDFCFHKQQSGHAVMVLTEDHAYRVVGNSVEGYSLESMNGGYENVNDEEPPGQRPQKVRKWLQEHYLDLGVKYVLLIGDPDPDNREAGDHVGDLPMVMVWQEPWFEHPTDLFYSDLSDSKWNYDRDAYVGERVPLSGEVELPAAVPQDEFSVRAEGNVVVTGAGTDESFRIRVITEGQTEIWFDANGDGITEADRILNDSDIHPPLESESIHRLSDGSYPLRVEYRQSSGDAFLVLMRVLPPDRSNAKASYETDSGDPGLSLEYFADDSFGGSAVHSEVAGQLSVKFLRGDRGPGGVDFLPEVLLGRIPVYDGDGDGDPDVDVLDSILRKTVAYKQANGRQEAWRRRVLCSTPHMYGDTADYVGCETLRAEIAPPPLWQWYRIHDEDYGVGAEATNGCSEDETVAGWNDISDPDDGRGLVMWRTHGWQAGASHVFQASRCNDLDDTRPSLVIQTTCQNGWPEIRGLQVPLGYSLLAHGAVATISSTRNSYGGVFDPENRDIGYKNNPYLLYYLAKGILGNVEFGETLAQVRSDDASSGRSWKNILNYNLYGDPSLRIFGDEPKTANDILFLLDGSGSMLSEGKWPAARNAAMLFYDLMRDLKPGDQDRYGAVVFRCIGGADECATLPGGGLREMDTPLALADFAGSTPAGHYLTPIGAGLERAVAELDLEDPESFYSQKLVVLLSDGKHNCGVDPRDVEIPGEVTVHTVGLGEDSIEPETLENLARETGGDFRISPNPRDLADFFLQILAASSWKLQDVPVVGDRVVIDESQAAFVAIWDDPSRSVTFELDPPGAGDNLSPTHSRAYPPMTCTFHGAGPEETHAYYVCEGIREDLFGEWRFADISDDRGAKPLTDVRLKVIEDPRLLADFAISGSLHVTGQPLVLTAQLRDGGRPLSGIDGIHADLVRSPSLPVGTLLAEAEADTGITEASTALDQTPWSRYLTTVMAERGLDTLATTETHRVWLEDDGEGFDARKGDGIYTGVFTGTAFEGSYTFRFRARGQRSDGFDFDRGQVLSAFVRFAPSAEVTEIDVVAVEERAGEGVAVANLQVTPRDASGAYLGPLRGGRLRVWSSSGHVTAEPDMLDGSYRYAVTFPLGDEPTISVAVGDTVVADRAPVRRHPAWGLSLHLGRTDPAASLARLVGGGPSVVIDLEHPLAQRLTGIAVLGYHRFEGKNGADDRTWWQLGGNLRYELPAQAAGRVLVNGGLGAYFPDQGSAEPGFNVGLAYRRTLRQDLDLEVGAEHHRILTPGPDQEFSIARAGVIFQF